MKTTLVRLEAQDDYISVRDKLAWSKTSRVLLVWPRRGGPRFRPFDWQMIRHAARRQGIQLAVVTRQAAVRYEAERVGLPVFSRLAEAQRTAWPRWEPLPRRPRADLQAWREALRQEKPDLPWPQRLGFFLLAVVAVFALGGVFVPRAQVRLVFPLQEVQVQLAAADLPLNTTQLVVEGTRIVPATGYVLAPAAAAEGEVVLTNISAAPLDVPRGAYLYALAETPVAFETLHFVHLEVEEQATVAVRAVTPGQAGNLPAEMPWSAGGTLGAALAVSNPQPLTGGEEIRMRGPSTADRQRVMAALMADLRSQALAELQAQQAAGEALLPETIRVAEVFEQFVLPPEGQAGTQAAAYARVAFAVDYVRAEDLQPLLATGFAPPRGFEPRWEALQVAVQGDEVTLTFPLQPNFPEGLLFGLVQGRRPSRAAARLQAELGTSRPPQIDLRPSFWPWLPWLPYQIQFIQQVE